MTSNYLSRDDERYRQSEFGDEREKWLIAEYESLNCVEQDAVYSLAKHFHDEYKAKGGRNMGPLSYVPLVMLYLACGLDLPS